MYNFKLEFVHWHPISVWETDNDGRRDHKCFANRVLYIAHHILGGHPAGDAFSLQRVLYLQPASSVCAVTADEDRCRLVAHRDHIWTCSVLLTAYRTMSPAPIAGTLLTRCSDCWFLPTVLPDSLNFLTCLAVCVRVSGGFWDGRQCYWLNGCHQ